MVVSPLISTRHSEGHSGKKRARWVPSTQRKMLIDPALHNLDTPKLKKSSNQAAVNHIALKILELLSRGRIFDREELTPKFKELFYAIDQKTKFQFVNIENFTRLLKGKKLAINPNCIRTYRTLKDLEKLINDLENRKTGRFTNANTITQEIHTAPAATASVVVSENQGLGQEREDVWVDPSQDLVEDFDDSFGHDLEPIEATVEEEAIAVPESTIVAEETKPIARHRLEKIEKYDCDKVTDLIKKMEGRADVENPGIDHNLADATKILISLIGHGLDGEEQEEKGLFTILNNFPSEAKLKVRAADNMRSQGLSQEDLLRSLAIGQAIDLEDDGIKNIQDRKIQYCKLQALYHSYLNNLLEFEANGGINNLIKSSEDETHNFKPLVRRYQALAKAEQYITKLKFSKKQASEYKASLGLKKFEQELKASLSKTLSIKKWDFFGKRKLQKAYLSFLDNLQALPESVTANINSVSKISKRIALAKAERYIQERALNIKQARGYKDQLGLTQVEKSLKEALLKNRSLVKQFEAN